MRGSIIVTFDELIEGIGGAYFDTTVNNTIRDRHFTNISNLYSSRLNLNDTFRILINTSPQLCVFTFNLTRRDYTTDDTDGNMGIIDTFITGITSTGTLFSIPNFTATTRPDAYDFEYRINLEINPINPISGQILAGVVNRNTYNYYNYLSTNTGTTFSEMTSLGADEWSGIAISDIGRYMSAVGESDIPTVYRSVNTGSTWTTITGFTESALLKHIDMSTTGQFQIAGGIRGDNYNGYVYVSTDYGATWGMKKQLSDRIGAFAISNNGQYMIAGEISDSGSLTNKYVYISDNYGQIWATLTSLPTDVFAYDLVTLKPGWIGGAISYNGQYITVANSAGQLYTSNNYGASFTRRINDWIGCPLPGGATQIISTQFRSINMSYSGQYQTALANSWGGPAESLCFNNSIWRSSNYGVTWTETSYTGNWGATNEGGALKVSASGQYQFAAKAQFTTYPPTQNPGLFFSTDYGVTWNELTSAPSTYWIGVGMNK
jgi:hypothetical protein